ncbi:MAG TPA: hypothetical protein VJ508_02295, partial [Saprospiraceae bacterium]|nr:hypothetical protein [Saprospiraceae bacterium]
FAVYGGLLSFFLIFRYGIQRLGPGNTVFFAIGGIVYLVCGIGFWLMKRWAVYTALAFGILDQIVLLLLGRWGIMALLIPLVIVYVGYRHLSKMS